MTGLADATIEQVETLRALTEMLVGVERTISGLQAAREGILALGSRLAVEVAAQAAHPDGADLSLRTVAAEFGAAVRASDRTVQRRMADAVWIVERFPRVWGAWGAGQITARHARVIAEAGEHLDDEAARDAYSVRMIAFAENEAPNRVAGMARRVAEGFQPRPLAERHEDARERRRVWVRDAPDGMAELGLLGPAALVHGVFDRLTAMAKTAHAGDDPTDPRTIAHTRADLALDLLLTGAPAGHDGGDGGLAAIVPTIAVTVPVMTLLGHGRAPAELDGRTPIDRATARRLAGAASGWDRILTHPVTGAVLAVDRYRPNAELRRHLRSRDQRCRFPGCGYPPAECDVDHHHDAALGGETTASNLGHLCRRHHVLKHHSAWHVEARGGGLYVWTSAAGKVCIDRPPPSNTATFTEESAAAPF